MRGERPDIMKQQQFTMTNEAATNHHLAASSAQIHVVGNTSQQQQQRRQPAQQQQQQIEPNHSHNHHQQHQQQQQFQQHQQQLQHQQHRLQQPAMGHQHQQLPHHHQQQHLQQAVPRHHQMLGSGSAGGSGSSLAASGHHHQSSASLKKELPANGKKTKGRVRIKMEFIHNKLRRYTTFSKRKTGIMKKAFELATLTGTQVMLLVASETGHVYTFATRKLQPMIISDAGKALIQTCLNSPDSDNLLMSASSSSTNSANSGHHNSANGGASTSQPSPSSSSPGSSTPGSSASPASSQHQQAGVGVGGQQQQHNMQQQQHHQQQQHQANSNVQYGAGAGSDGQAQVGSVANSPANSAGNQGALCQQGAQQANIQSQHNMMLAASNSAQTSQTNSNSNRSNGNTNDSSNASGGANSGASNVATSAAPTTTTTANNQSSNNQTTNGTTNHANNSTTDQRMSATGFEETELSYSINDDLNDRAFNNCLPISIGTIEGSVNGASAISSANVITSPQAFEQTLQSQEADSNGACHGTNSNQQQNQGRRQQVNGHHHQHQQNQQHQENHQHQHQRQQQHQHPATCGKSITSNRASGQRVVTIVDNAFDTPTSNNNGNNKGNNKAALIEQQSSGIQLLPASVSPLQPLQLPQFNYNPLYMSAHHFASSQLVTQQNSGSNNNSGCNSVVNGGGGGGDKAIGALASEHHHHPQQQQQHELNGIDNNNDHEEEEEDDDDDDNDDGCQDQDEQQHQHPPNGVAENVLSDIYQYHDPSAAPVDSQCATKQQQHCHSASTAPDGTNPNSQQHQQYCSAHHQQANGGSYIQTNGVRKQEMLFTSGQHQQRQQQHGNLASTRYLGSLANCRQIQSHQQQACQQQSTIIGNQNCVDGMSSTSSSPLQGAFNVGGQKQRIRRNQMHEQHEQPGRKRMSSMNSNQHQLAYHANNQMQQQQQQRQHHNNQQQLHGGHFQHSHQQHQQQDQQHQHQHQFTVGGGNDLPSHQLDLPEECNGLFVEYHTNNRNSLGELEELHSLNVTNGCDSETLEEHINMLTNEDCFASNDDLQDFGIGSTNDHFLNMLLMNSNQGSQCNGLQLGQPLESHLGGESTVNNLNQSSSITCNSMSFNQIEQLVGSNNGSCGGVNNTINSIQAAGQLGGLAVNDAAKRNASIERQLSPLTPLLIGDQQQHHHQSQVGQVRKTARGVKKSSSSAAGNMTILMTKDSSLSTATKRQANVIAATVARRKNATTGAAGQKPPELSAAAAHQNKINTTNTNKRLLPKKAAPVLTGQQLAKPKKTNATANKCIANNSSPWTASPSSTSNTSIGSALSPNSSSQFEYEAPYRQQLENLRKKLKMDVAPIRSAATTNKTTGAATTIMNNEAQKDNRISCDLTATTKLTMTSDRSSDLSAYAQPKTLVTASGVQVANAKTVFVSQGSSEESSKSNTTTAYVLGPQGFETNGTIYLRTSTGLVPINSSSSHERRPSPIGGQQLPIVSLAGGGNSATTTTTTTAPADFPGSVTGASAVINSSLIINCVGDAQYSKNGTMTTQQGPIALTPTGGVIFHSTATPSADDQQTESNQSNASQQRFLTISSASSSSTTTMTTTTTETTALSPRVGASSDSITNVSEPMATEGEGIRIVKNHSNGLHQQQAETSLFNVENNVLPTNGNQLESKCSIVAPESIRVELLAETEASTSNDQYQHQMSSQGVNVATTMDNGQQQHLFRDSIERLESESSLNTKSMPSDVSINVGN